MARIRLRIWIRNNRITDPDPEGQHWKFHWRKNLLNLKQTCFLLLQDQYDQIAVHTQKGIDFLEKYGNFVDQRCKIEQEYATKLRYVYSSGQTNEP
jgi:hypothetical protein